MSKKKVLIIVRDFIPYSFTLGGAMRVLKMAEFFREKGIESYVLAARGESISYFGYEELVKKIPVYYVADKLQMVLTKIHNERIKGSQSIKKAGVILYSLKKLIDEFSIPDRGIYFVNNLVKKAREIITTSDIKNVIVSSPPHSTQIIGLKLKKIFGSKINLIVDYRDSWNTTGIFAKHNPVSRWLSEKKEREVLSNADYFLYHSPRVLSKICEKIFDVSKKSLLVMNGYDEKMKQNVILSGKNQNEYLTIGHFGSIRDSVNSFRNPEKFFAAVLKTGKKIKLVFYGPADIRSDWQRKFGQMLELHKSVSHQDMFKVMSKMDLLLVLHSQEEGADEVIPAKFYEYILVEKPILSVGPLDMEVSQIVSEKKLGYVMNIYDESEMVQKLSSIYADWKANNLIKYNRNEHPEFSRQYQYAKILEILR